MRKNDRTCHAGIRTALVFLLCLCTVFACASCSQNQSGSTLDEPDITLDYLKGEYTEQLLRDGAEHVFGTIEIAMEDDGTTVREITLHQKEYVEDANHENGFYIADCNKSYLVQLPAEARTSYLYDGSEEPEILAPADFVTAVNTDFAAHEADYAAFRDSRLYDVYLFDDQILLILAF